MCVITNQCEDYSRAVNNTEACNNCGEPLRYPFLEWRGERPFYLCGGCCAEIKRGMIADVIHLAAVSELQALFSDHILTREHISDVEKRIEAREAEWHASIKEVEARETEAMRSVCQVRHT